MKMQKKILYLLLAVVPLLLSPVFQLIDNHRKIISLNGNTGLAGFGLGLSNLFNYAFIILVCILGTVLFFKLQNGVVNFNPLKLIIQWDGFAKNAIRILGYVNIYFSYDTIRRFPYRDWASHYELLWGIFGLIGTLLFVLIFCSTESSQT